MPDKETLRKLFGKMGDVHPVLAKMFGSAYLDHPDDTKDIPEAILNHAQETNVEVFNVSGLVDRVIENVLQIDRHDTQGLFIKHLDHLTEGSPEISYEEVWQILGHMHTCLDPICHELFIIFQMDKYFDGEEMKKCYGRKIEDLRKRSALLKKVRTYFKEKR